MNVNDRRMSHMERVARMAIDHIEESARLISHDLGAAYGVERLTPEQEDRYWMLMDPSVNADRMRAEGLPEEAIGSKMFPMRERMMRSGGRISLVEQVAYVDRLNARITRRAGAGNVPENPLMTMVGDTDAT